MVAILTGEPQRAALLLILDSAETPMTSVLAIFETVAAVSRRKAQSVTKSAEQVREFLRASQFRIVALGDSEGVTALAAFGRYGKGRGHPAELNMGDCFAYACARTRDVPLLFVGNDFSQTDIRSAMS